MNKMNEKKNPVTDFIEKNIFITLIVVAATIIGSTYLVIDKLLLVHYKLKIETLESIKSENKEAIFELKKNIVKKDIEIDSLVKKIEISSKDINNIKSADIRIEKLKQLISIGEKISKKEINKNETSYDFLLWRRDCLAFISSIKDSENKVVKFSQSTNLTESNYPMIPQMIQNGIEILESLRGDVK